MLQAMRISRSDSRRALSAAVDSTYRVPPTVTQPRSAVSAVNRVFKAADGFGLAPNPLPRSLQNGISAVGAGFAVVNVAAELMDRDFSGALEDVSNGAVSLSGGLRLSPVPSGAVKGFQIAGAALNVAYSARDFRRGDRFAASLKLGNAVGLCLSVIGGSVAGPLSYAVLGATGVASVANYYLSDETAHEPVLTASLRNPK